MLSPATELLNIPPYSLNQAAKEEMLLPKLKLLTEHHRRNCSAYSNILERVYPHEIRTLTDIPFLPVSLFKNHVLKSIRDEDVQKVLTSSGTTGQKVSQIYLDRETARIQSTVLIKVVQHFIGSTRLPMVILDHPGVVRDRTSFSARGAGIMGMAQFGHRPFYALREDLSLDLQGLKTYIAGTGSSRLLLFGFTFMVWQGLVESLARTGERVDLSRGILVHSGGWKKLQEKAVSPGQFRESLQDLAGINSVINFYGMVEQVGGVYFENAHHYLHAPVYSDIIIRDPTTLQPLPDGTSGLIQVVSCLPTSYPGHSLLTEDIGVIRGVDDPGLEMKGKYFEVLGRVPKAEIRGCSDTVEPLRGMR